MAAQGSTVTVQTSVDRMKAMIRSAARDSKASDYTTNGTSDTTNQVKYHVNSDKTRAKIPLSTKVEIGAYIAPDAQLGEGCYVASGSEVHTGVKIGNYVTILDGVVIEPHCQVDDSVIVGPDVLAHIHSNLVNDPSVQYQRCVIAPDSVMLVVVPTVRD